jgi:hypothetical protein
MRWPFRRTPTAEPASGPTAAAYWKVDADLLREFVRAGFRARHCFPHAIRYLPRPGSDGQVLAERMYGVTDPSRLRQVVLHAHGPALDGIPASAFFDRDLVWHEQHLGLPGHVAAANLVLAGQDLLTTARYADIVQRISRRRDLATRVEKRFRGWDHMLLNAIFNYAVERDVRRIRLPGSSLALENTDRRRNPKPALFERIYDHDVQRRFHTRREGRFWVVDVRDNLDRRVRPVRAEESLGGERAICICHDTERELGHVTADPHFARVAADVSARNLERVLEIEARAGVRGTYAVVGRLLPALRPAIEANGHEVAFHGYDHDLGTPQLGRCREVDYRIPGYRPPQSAMTPELTDLELARRNFEWVASSARSIGTLVPQVRAPIARIPVHLDDFPLYRSAMSWRDWEAEALRQASARDTTVLGVHDCYAHWWLDHYEGFLARLADAGRLRTIGSVAAELFRRAAE